MNTEALALRLGTIGHETLVCAEVDSPRIMVVAASIRASRITIEELSDALMAPETHPRGHQCFFGGKYWIRTSEG